MKPTKNIKNKNQKKKKRKHEEEESIKETKQNPRRKTKNTNDIYIDTPQRPPFAKHTQFPQSHPREPPLLFLLLVPLALLSPLPCHVALSALCKCCPICQLAQICISVAQPSGRMTYGCPLTSAPVPPLPRFSVHSLFLLSLSNTFPTQGPEPHRTWAPCQRLISRSKKFSLKLAVKCHQ